MLVFIVFPYSEVFNTWSACPDFGQIFGTRPDQGGDQTRVFGTRPDQGGDQTRIFGSKIQFCRFYRDGKYSFTVLPGPGKTMY